MNNIELRKQKEARYHNKVRDEKLGINLREYNYLTSNRKFYSVNRKSRKFITEWILRQKEGKKILDYCCGNGDFSIFLVKNGARVVGIDISEASIKNAQNAASREGVSKNASFFVMDAERTEFPDNYFDLIVCMGVLHHLEISKAFKELSRIVKPDGKIICDEPLIYNPIFQLYRRLTPQLRTTWEAEHILSKKDLDTAKEYFGKIETDFFHLTVLMAVPFRNWPGFNFILEILEKIDSFLLKLPLIKWLAWQIVFILSQPKKS